eukprot:755242-Rhodomonas_salina.1
MELSPSTTITVFALGFISVLVIQHIYRSTFICAFITGVFAGAFVLCFYIYWVLHLQLHLYDTTAQNLICTTAEYLMIHPA